MTDHPSTDFYTLGRGVLSIATFSGGAPGAYALVGNCPRLDISLTEEQLEHFSSQGGLKTKDKVVDLSVGYDLEFELDEISRVNMAKFFKGSISGPRIKALMNTGAEYALRFVSDNPVGKNFTWYFRKVKLSPAGAFGLLSDDWSKMAFKASGQSDTVNHPTSPYFDILEMTTTSTT